MIRASVIIVTFNNQSTIQKCLDSVLKEESLGEIIVVDNNSEDGTTKILKNYAPNIILINNNVNLGFSKANNIGAKKAAEDFLIFLNPDTKFLKKDTIKDLITVLESKPSYGLIGPKLINNNGKVQKSARNLPTLWNAIKEYWLQIKNTFEFYIPEGNEVVEVGSVVGACMIMRKEIFERVGGFDEKYFLYFEDLQLCKDIQRLGFKIGYAPNIIVQHAHGISGIGKNTSSLSIESSRKYYGSFGFFMIQLIGRIGNKLRS